MPTVEDKKYNIELMVRVECEAYFQLNQEEVAEKIGVAQSTISDYRKDPYYQQCIVNWKGGKIGEMQLKSSELVDRTIQLGHDSLEIMDKALLMIKEAGNKAERANGFTALKMVLGAFQDGRDMARWLLEKTDAQYKSTLEIINPDTLAPADGIPLTPELKASIEEKAANTSALVPYKGPEQGGNGRKGNGES